MPADSHPAEYVRRILRTLRQHWILEVSVGVVILAAAAIYVMRLPPVYSAETRILVNPQKISTQYVSSAVAMGQTERLDTLSQQILSSSRLEAIIDELNLFPELRDKLGKDKIVDLMRKRITIQLKQSSVGPSSFTLGYTGTSPKEVAQVTNRLAQSFITWNLHEREQEAQGTTAFLQSELAKAKARLDTLETQVRAYKEAHVGQLPEQLQSNLETLSRLQLELRANLDAQSRLDHEEFMAKLNEPADGIAPLSPVHSASSLQEQRSQAEADLRTLLTQYTPEYPDVRMKEDEIRRLDAQIAVSPAPAAKRPASTSAAKASPQLEMIAQDRQHLIAEQRSIQAQIQQYQADVNAAPIREQEMADLSRDYEAAKQNYSALLQKTYSADMAAQLEQQQQGASFTMLDPAQVPDSPIGPNRSLLLFASVMFALACGIGSGILAESLNTTVKSESMLGDILPDIPLLGVLPPLDSNDPLPLGLRFPGATTLRMR